MTDKEFINYEETQKLKEDPLRQNFLKWVYENGLKTKHIQFPVAFGPLGVPGIGSSEYIPANTVIAAIPNKLMITVNKALQSELKIMFDENKEQFDLENNQDAEINILAMFLLFERVKGEKSFWYHYIESIGKSYTLMDWTKYDIKLSEDPLLQDEFKFYIDEMMDVWLKLNLVIQKYPQFYPQGSVTRNIFLECYEAVMTRCFGWSLPSTSLIPFADMLNHHIETATHYIVQTQFEMNTKQKHKQYKVKKKKIDMSIFEQDALKQDPSNFIYDTDRAKYVQLYRKKLPKNLQDFDMTKIEYDQLKQLNYEINNQLIKEDNNNPWNPDIQYFTTTDSEDNDTSDSDDDENIHTLQVKEAKSKEEKRIKYMLSQKKEGFKQQYAEDILKISKLSLKEETEKKQKKSKKEQQEEETKSQHSSSSSSDESEWEWYDEEQEDTYFVVSTNKPVQRDSQIFNCYGSRKNSFLLMWYGFTIQNNIYDSFTFRLHMNCKTDKFDDSILGKIIFRKFLYNEELRYGKYTQDGEELQISDLTKEFRLKSSRINDHLILYLRASLMKFYNEKDQAVVCVTIPVSFEYELFILRFYLKMITYFQSQYSTTIEEDQKLLEDIEIGYKERFSIILRQSQKQILQSQSQIVKQAINLIGIQKEQQKTLSEAILTNFDNIETESLLLEERHKLKPYIEQLKEGYSKKVLNQLYEEHYDINNNK